MVKTGQQKLKKKHWKK